MHRARVLAVTAAAALTVTAAALAGDPIGSLPRGWSHAEINVTVKGTPHTLIFDRGRVQSASATALVLKERDGSVVTVAVNPRTRVRINGQPGSLSDVQPGYLAITVRMDGGAARQLRAFRPRAAG